MIDAISPSICSGCGKHPAVCMCRGNISDALARELNKPVLVGTAPIKKWADECRDTAKKVRSNPPPEPKSLYIFMLERCKYACTAGDFTKVFFGRRTSRFGPNKN